MAAWLFRLVFYGGSLTLIGLHFLGGGGEATAARPPDLVGQIDGGARMELWLKDGQVVRWENGVVEIECGKRTWEAAFWVIPSQGPSRHDFSSFSLIHDPQPGLGVGDVRVYSSGTAAPGGASARGRIRITGSFDPPGPAVQKPIFCDSGELSWSASRKP